MALAIDVNTNSGGVSIGSGGTVSTPSFSTASGNELLVAFCMSNAGGPAANIASFSVSGAGLTWSLAFRENSSPGGGTSEIWTASAPSVLTSQTVTATLTLASGSASMSYIVLLSFTGASSSVGATAGGFQANGGSNAASVTLTTTTANSWVFACGNDWWNSTARTIGPNQTMVYQDANGAFGCTAWVQEQNTTTASAGTSVTMNDTAPTNSSWNFAAVEITLPSTASVIHMIGLLGVG